jgi:5-formyltetrahydrofolate cyclo-ligase
MESDARQAQNMKSRLRQQLRRQMSEVDSVVRYARSLAACKHLVQQPEFLSANVLMIFLSLPDEVDTAALALAAWQMNKTVCAPRVDWEHRKMMPVEITSLDTHVKVGLYEAPQPAEARLIPLEMLDLVVVPGVAFDRKGRRLGRGGGFYDRFLAQGGLTAVTCGLALREQVLDDLSSEPHDQNVKMLVTDEEVLRFE